jgi:ATP synthase protein I
MTPRRDGLDRAVRERRERRERGHRGGERSLAKSLAIAGALGWTIVLPALAGVAAGRWLDRELQSGIVFTAALLFAGIAIGCTLAWRRVRT